MSENDAFDPNAPEGDGGGKSAYLSKKDIRNIFIVLVVLMGLMFPIYKIMERDSADSRCILNMKAISDSFGEYAVVHDERFPPLFAAGPNGEPALHESGHPFVWASDISEFMNPRASFLCPSSDASEATIVESQRQQTSEEKDKGLPAAKTMELSYGFYAPYAGYLRSQIDSPAQTVVITETSNLGALGTYDPLPYKDAAGAGMPFDGFAIGWNNSNAIAGPLSKALTRLAFYDTKNGKFTSDKAARHDQFIHALTADGSLLKLRPGAGNVVQQAGTIQPPWSVPAGSYEK